MTALLLNDVAILVSERSRVAYARRAQECGQTYSFLGANGRHMEWLKGDYAYLAPAALSSILHRWEIKHDLMNEEDLADQLASYCILFIPNAGHLSEAHIACISDWLEHPKHFLVVTGKTNVPNCLLGLERREEYLPDGYTGWRWLADSPFSHSSGWEPCYVSSYRGYACARARASSCGRVLAELVEFTGNCSSAAAATTTSIGAAIVATPKSLYVANQIFEFLGGVWQAHLNVEEIRLWSNPTNWGDTLVYFLRTVLQQTEARRLWELTLAPFGTYDGVLQLRHDIDHEQHDVVDLSMLEYQAQNAVPASYYVMDPAFCRTRCTTAGSNLWIERAARYNFIEVAQHHDSVVGDPPKWITGTGLLQHIQESDLTMGTISRTAGRHMGFLVYPETIDAMDYLYEHDSAALGLCTFSLYDVIEYGVRNPEIELLGKQLTYTTYDHANPDIPASISGYWFPYHAVVSTVDGQRILRGWDVTHDTDCDYDRIEAIFSGRMSNIVGDRRTLGNGVFTIQFESQRAHEPHQNETKGHMPWLRYAIALGERRNFWITTKRSLYERMNDYQDIVVRRDGHDGLILHNPTGRTIQGLMARSDRPVNVAINGDRSWIHITNERIVGLPSLPPGTTAKIRLTHKPEPGPVITQPNSRFVEIIEAILDQVTGTIDVRGNIIRTGHVVVHGLPRDRDLIAEVMDNRGGVRIRLRTDSIGRLAIPILGQQDNLIPFAISVGINQ